MIDTISFLYLSSANLPVDEAIRDVVLDICYDKKMCQELGIDYLNIGNKKDRKAFFKIGEFVIRTLEKRNLLTNTRANYLLSSNQQHNKQTNQRANC
jgi:hypothetical protein